MKKVLFITMLFLMMTTLFAQGQTPVALNLTRPEMARQADPSQLQMIRNAEAKRLKTYSNKGTAGLPGIPKNTEMRALENSIRLNGMDVESAYDYYRSARLMLGKAEREKNRAEKKFAELPGKQQLENAQMQEKFDQSLSMGLDREQWQKLEDKKSKLDEKHTAQIVEAQQRLSLALRKYDQALRNYDQAREVYETAKLRFERSR